ncbi:uncharacterized protein MEPE_02298 [Melanopsichium pennsylvanicum]|uniref:Peptidase C15, pyroglutamyl peptidase I-like protein n=2 Tax=Melanopsichium pennsylvanicum TaxID=63383 RepID=A0AAJ4XKR8_9BASI|nr:conserved hypothetical protein [Melanopsichium pennsylvanicum 4]SNX83591.1 uncharacterized protein MEPE_02298 [Melanopsichium pennsylvanicum]
MAPTSRSREISILITGFGPFMSVADNPSWLAVKTLDNSVLSLHTPPSLDASSSSASTDPERGVRARIQTLQMPVHYGSVLDLVPRIHGTTPSCPEAKFWHDSRLDPHKGGQEGQHYPGGYSIEHPSSGFDIVIHVGVGRGGSLRCETQAHKSGYAKPDANGEFAPLLPKLSPTQLSSEGILAKHLDKNGRLRGFDVGYEEFSTVENTAIDVPQLVNWLKERGMQDREVEQSVDPGRYLCDFIFYASLCEAKRERGQDGAEVIFIHVPPAGQDLQVERCRDAIRAIAWYMAREKASVDL